MVHGILTRVAAAPGQLGAGQRGEDAGSCAGCAATRETAPLRLGQEGPCCHYRVGEDTRQKRLWLWSSERIRKAQKGARTTETGIQIAPYSPQC